MKKFILSILTLVLFIFCFGCTQEITGAVFEDAQFVYDGTQKSIEVQGLDNSYEIIYSNNDKTELGDYTVTAVISKAGYATLTLSATLSIVGSKEEILQYAEFEDGEFEYDGTEKALAVKGLDSSYTVTYHNNNQKEIGDYTVTATISKYGYETLVLQAVLTINPVDIFKDAMFEDGSFVYNGYKRSIYVQNAEFFGVTYEGNAQINAGIYEVTATLRSGSTSKVLTAVMTIEKAPTYFSGKDVQTAVYQAKELTPLLSINHKESSISFREKPRNAGVYTVIAEAAESDNYLYASKEINFTIEKAVPKIITQNVFYFDYDGVPKNVTADTDNEETTVNTTEGKVFAGTYSILLEVEETANYKSASLYTTLVINKAEAVITAENIQEFKFDQLPKKAAGQLNHDESEIYTSAKTEAGTYTVTLTANESANYNSTFLDVTLIIKPDINLVRFDDKTVKYDGRTHKIEVSVLQKGISVVYSANEFRNVSINEVSATLSADGEEDRVLWATLTIQKVPLVVTMDDQEMIKERSFPKFTFKVTGLSTMDSFYSLGTLEVNPTTDGTHTGKFNIIASGLSSPNYDISYVDAVLTVRELNTKLIAGGLHLDGDGNTVYDGEAINWLGVNYYSMVNSCYESGVVNENSIKTVLNALTTLAKYNVKAIRFNLAFFYVTDWGYYFKNQDAYYNLLFTIFDKAAECNIGLVPSFFWTDYLIDYFGENYLPAFTNPRENESKTLAFMLEFSETIVEKFKSHPAILMWEWGNEWNLAMDLPDYEWYIHNPGKDKSIDKMTLGVHTEVIELWAETVRNADPYGRLISTGDSDLRKSNYNQYINSNWNEDSPAEHLLALKLFNPGYIDSISVHLYGDNAKYTPDNMGALDGIGNTKNWDARLGALVNTARGLRKSCYVGEAGFSYKDLVAPVDLVMLENHYKAILAASKKHNFPLILFWNFDPLALKVPGDLTDRGSGIEFSWNYNWDKGKIILDLISQF